MAAEAGALADFITLHPLFSFAPLAALVGIAWVVVRRPG